MKDEEDSFRFILHPSSFILHPFRVTLFGLFLTPVFYFVVRWLVERRAPATATAAEAAIHAQPPHPPV